LVWNREHKILDVAFGIKKLQVACVIEDDKVSTDDLFEIIEGWEEVQSTEVVTMQKV
jgi:elongation factor 1-beta